VPDERLLREQDDQPMNDRERASVVDVMHRGVISCPGESSALTAARVMAAHRIHCVVVVGADRAPRLITDMDVAGAIYDEQLETLSADDLSRPSPLLRPEDTLAFALERMHEHATSHAVVVGSSLRLLGVIAVLDVVEWILRKSPQPDQGEAPMPTPRAKPTLWA
jgi:CBS domain-containing protein